MVNTKNIFLTVLSSPSVINIKKKIIAQNTDPFKVAMASGYTTNTRPGPKINI